MIRTIAPHLDEARVVRLLRELGDEAGAYRFEIAPNPAVGAALVVGGEPVARGYHEEWGEPHAEVQAFEAARAARIDPATAEALVVTLEPCSSHGKTGPCVEAIRAAGVKCVVVGALDPDPRHRGEGLRQLQAAGIEVCLLEGASPVHEVTPQFMNWISPDRLRRPRPWTVAKWAQTRTGQLVPPEGVGDGRWITGGAARAEVQLLRSRVDAIVTGIGTVLADDPRLTVREPGDPTHTPLRVVLDSHLRTPPESLMFRPAGDDEGAGRVHLLSLAGGDVGRARALDLAGAALHGMHTDEAEGVSLRETQQWMWDNGVRRMLLEAGPTLLGRYLEHGFVDQVRVYSGDVNGGRGPSMGEWLTRLELEGRLDRELGPDVVLEGFVKA